MFSEGECFGNLSIQGKRTLNNMKNCCYEFCSSETNFLFKIEMWHTQEWSMLATSAPYDKGGGHYVSRDIRDVSLFRSSGNLELIARYKFFGHSRL